jgi:hypothetical protein
MQSKVLVCVLFFLNALYVSAAVQSKNIRWRRARIEVLRVAGSGSFETFTAMPSWTPTISLNNNVSMGITTGYSLYNKTSNSKFSVFEYALVGSYRFSKRWGMELHAGAQTWVGDDLGTGELLGANAKYIFDRPIFKVVDHVVAGYSYIHQENAYSAIRLGLGFRF